MKLLSIPRALSTLAFGLLVGAQTFVQAQETPAVLPSGEYYLRSALGNVYLNVPDGNISDGTGVQITTFEGTPAQAWYFSQDLTGDYATGHLQSMVAKPGTRYSYTGHLNVRNSSSEIGSFAETARWSRDPSQQWSFIPAGDGSYFIQSGLGTYLDVQWGNGTSGTPVWTWSLNQGGAQRWYAEPHHHATTVFDPGWAGFKFTNNFTNDFIPVLDWRTNGLCGGMSYAALDYYFASSRSIPQQWYAPGNGTPLRSYLYDRQVTSLNNNLDQWFELGNNPLGTRNHEFFEWGLSNDSRITPLRHYLDAGIPVPIGLQGTGETGNHQMVAIGYDMGRYAGDLGSNKGEFKIFVYDPNSPNTTRTPHSRSRERELYPPRRHKQAVANLLRG